MPLLVVISDKHVAIAWTIVSPDPVNKETIQVQESVRTWGVQEGFGRILGLAVYSLRYSGDRVSTFLSLTAELANYTVTRKFVHDGGTRILGNQHPSM